MIKQLSWAVIAVFICWSVLDFIIHGVLLDSVYRETASLWRPENEMKMGLMSLVTFVISVCFVYLYSYLIKPKSLATGVKYGVVFGIISGVSMGFGSYTYMPIPFSLSLSWFFGAFIEMTVAGVIVGWLIKTPPDGLGTAS